MNQKIVFFDIDGTLITEDGKETLPDSTLTAIQQLRSNGHLAYINSGRTYFNVAKQSYIKQIGFDGFVCACGAHIYCDEKTLVKYEVPAEVHGKIVEAARKNGVHLVFEGPEKLYFDHTFPMCRPMRQLYEKYPDNRGNVDDPQKRINKFIVWERPGCDMQQFVQAAAPWFDYINRGGGFGEFCPIGYSKATGIQFLADHYGLNLSDCYVIGDSMNDLPMLEYVEHSILMGNGAPALFSCVEYITSDILDDGIANALKHYDLIS